MHAQHIENTLKMQRRLDTLFRGTTRGFAFLVLATLIGIIISLIIGAMPTLQSFGFSFYSAVHGIRLLKTLVPSRPFMAPW